MGECQPRRYIFEAGSNRFESYQTCYNFLRSKRYEKEKHRASFDRNYFTTCKGYCGFVRQKTTALGIFRDTAENLAAINEDLNKSIINFDNLTKFIMEQKLSAEQMVSDNDKVRNKILEILGD